MCAPFSAAQQKTGERFALSLRIIQKQLLPDRLYRTRRFRGVRGVKL